MKRGSSGTSTMSCSDSVPPASADAAVSRGEDTGRTTGGLRVLFALPGLHRMPRGAEVAFESLADRIARKEGYEVTLIGSGEPRPDRRYGFVKAGCLPRERFEKWPRFPVLRSDCAYEELTFVPGLYRRFDPGRYDVTVACSYPFTNWVLRAKARRNASRPIHIYVTQNGDWPCQARNSEFRFFRCDGLVCTNPDYYETNKDRWPSVLIPNGVDPSLFHPGERARPEFGLPADAVVVLMVSALIPSKRVVEGIAAVSRMPEAHIVVAGDGPDRDRVRAVAEERMPGRCHLLNLPRASMPALYRSCDVFLHMSQVEASANAYIEALATGLPIVTHDRAVTRWTLEDQGLLVDSGDEHAVVRGLEQALDRRTPDDVASRRALVERRFTWASIADRYTEFFHQRLE